MSAFAPLLRAKQASTRLIRSAPIYETHAHRDVKNETWKIIGAFAIVAALLIAFTMVLWVGRLSEHQHPATNRVVV